MAQLPRVQDYARAQAICNLARDPGDPQVCRADVYGVDEMKAYCFLQVQRAHHYASCYLWPDEEGVVRSHIAERMVFGGSPWPNRFERFSVFQCAWIQHKQRLFDAAHPLPAAARAWVQRRRALQQAGVLPPGEAQVWPAGVEPYIDDLSGRALSDPVPVPPELLSFSTGAARAQPQPPPSGPLRRPSPPEWRCTAGSPAPR